MTTHTLNTYLNACSSICISAQLNGEVIWFGYNLKFHLVLLVITINSVICTEGETKKKKKKSFVSGPQATLSRKGKNTFSLQSHCNHLFRRPLDCEPPQGRAGFPTWRKRSCSLTGWDYSSAILPTCVTSFPWQSQTLNITSGTRKPVLTLSPWVWLCCYWHGAPYDLQISRCLTCPIGQHLGTKCPWQLHLSWVLMVN